MQSHRLTIALLAILCLVAAGIVFTEMSGSDATAQDPSNPGASASAKMEAPAPNANFSLPGLSSFASIGERPLFSPSRRPAARAADDSGAWSSFILAGTIITPQSREALVSHGNPPTIAHVGEGETIDGWTVKAIYPDHVVFSDRLNEHELRLIDKTPPLPRQPGAPPPQRRQF